LLKRLSVVFISAKDMTGINNIKYLISIQAQMFVAR
jgi:translation initiation factor IF-2